EDYTASRPSIGRCRLRVILDGQPDLAIEPFGSTMERYGKAVERVRQPHLLPDRVMRIEKTLRGLVPQRPGDGIDQVVGSIVGDRPKRVEPDGRCRDPYPWIGVGRYRRTVVRTIFRPHFRQ